MIRQFFKDPAMIGAAVVAIAAAAGMGVSSLFATSLGAMTTWVVAIVLPVVAAFVLGWRLRSRADAEVAGNLEPQHAEPRDAELRDDVMVQARELVDRVLAHSGERVLRVDRAGRIAADLGGDPAGLPIDPSRALVGHALAGLFDPVMRDILGGVIAAAAEGIGGSVDLAVPPFTPGEGDSSGGAARWIALRLVPVSDGMLALMRDVTDRRQLEQRLGQVALVDPLTGLANRQAFVRTLERHCAGGGMGCIALFDIDHLKRINDRHGQAVGDAVLRAFALDAAAHVRASDSLARISGETFAVILPGADVGQAERVAARIVTRFGGAGRTAGDAIVRATVSAGIALWRETPAETIRQAERALLEAKARGRDRVEVADPARRPAGSRW
jgi:diguanylate cyclase (GGDEF)-like protein